MTVWIYLARLMGTFFPLGEICMLPDATGSFCQRKWRLVFDEYDGIRSYIGRVDLSMCVWK